jgi:hypothetical protein
MKMSWARRNASIEQNLNELIKSLSLIVLKAMPSLIIWVKVLSQTELSNLIENGTN